jgi:hypothetical protein
MSITMVLNHISDTVLAFLTQFMHILSNNFNNIYIFISCQRKQKLEEMQTHLK